MSAEIDSFYLFYLTVWSHDWWKAERSRGALLYGGRGLVVGGLLYTCTVMHEKSLHTFKNIPSMHFHLLKRIMVCVRTLKKDETFSDKTSSERKKSQHITSFMSRSIRVRWKKRCFSYHLTENSQ